MTEITDQMVKDFCKAWNSCTGGGDEDYARCALRRMADQGYKIEYLEPTVTIPMTRGEAERAYHAARGWEEDMDLAYKIKAALEELEQAEGL